MSPTLADLKDITEDVDLTEDMEDRDLTASEDMDRDSSLHAPSS